MVGSTHHGERAAAVLSCVLLCIAACSYDWTVAKGGGSGGGGAGGSAGSSQSAQCAALKAAVANARRDAKTCAGAMADCSQIIVDECDCTTHVNGDAYQVGAYQGTLNEFRAANCVADCPDACSSSTFMCIITATSGGQWVCDP